MNLVLRYSRECLLIIVFLMIAFPATSQQLYGQNKILIIGQVTNQLNGGPIKQQQVTIISDSLYSNLFTYHRIVHTDIDGYFYDTIYTFINKGALHISTVDYLNINHDSTVYFRFNWSDENILFTNFILPIEPPQIIYQANFYFLKNPSGQNPSEYQFFDITNSPDQLERLWDFGDSTFSTDQNPIHEFTSTGVYKIKLTVKIGSLPGVTPYVTSIIKIINVTIKNYFYLGGHVMGGYFPIDYGEAYLYKIEEKDIVLIDTALFNDTLGYYLFYQVIEGEYLVKADLCPNSIHFNHFMTTYYSNKPVWTEADTIFHYENGCDYDINLIPVEQTFNGTGSISGTIFYGYDPMNEKSVPASNIEILLIDENNEPLICCHSDENGDFTFENLDFLTYSVHPEVTGKYTFPIKLTLDAENPEAFEIMLTIGSYTVNGNVNSITDFDQTSDISQPYPNPANDFVNFDLSVSAGNEFLITLFNCTGEVIKTFELTNPGQNNHLKIDIEELASGIYMIKMSSGNKETIKKFIKR
jgi:PKD repeat protein